MVNNRNICNIRNHKKYLRNLSRILRVVHRDRVRRFAGQRDYELAVLRLNVALETAVSRVVFEPMIECFAIQTVNHY